jgi:hypothetical protein
MVANKPNLLLLDICHHGWHLQSFVIDAAGVTLNSCDDIYVAAYVEVTIWGQSSLSLFVASLVPCITVNSLFARHSS